MASAAPKISTITPEQQKAFTELITSCAEHFHFKVKCTEKRKHFNKYEIKLSASADDNARELVRIFKEPSHGKIEVKQPTMIDSSYKINIDLAKLQGHQLELLSASISKMIPQPAPSSIATTRGSTADSIRRTAGAASPAPPQPTFTAAAPTAGQVTPPTTTEESAGDSTRHTAGAASPALPQLTVTAAASIEEQMPLPNNTEESAGPAEHPPALPEAEPDAAATSTLQQTPLPQATQTADNQTIPTIAPTAPEGALISHDFSQAPGSEAGTEAPAEGMFNAETQGHIARIASMDKDTLWQSLMAPSPLRQPKPTDITIRQKDPIASALTFMVYDLRRIKTLTAMALAHYSQFLTDLLKALNRAETDIAQTTQKLKSEYDKARESARNASRLFDAFFELLITINHIAPLPDFATQLHEAQKSSGNLIKEIFTSLSALYFIFLDSRHLTETKLCELQAQTSDFADDLVKNYSDLQIRSLTQNLASQNPWLRTTSSAQIPNINEMHNDIHAFKAHTDKQYNGFQDIVRAGLASYTYSTTGTTAILFYAPLAPDSSVSAAGGAASNPDRGNQLIPH